MSELPINKYRSISKEDLLSLVLIDSHTLSESDAAAAEIELAYRYAIGIIDTMVGKFDLNGAEAGIADIARAGSPISYLGMAWNMAYLTVNLVKAEKERNCAMIARIDQVIAEELDATSLRYLDEMVVYTKRVDSERE